MKLALLACATAALTIWVVFDFPTKRRKQFLLSDVQHRFVLVACALSLAIGGAINVGWGLHLGAIESDPVVDALAQLGRGVLAGGVVQLIGALAIVVAEFLIRSRRKLNFVQLGVVFLTLVGTVVVSRHFAGGIVGTSGNLNGALFMA